MSKPDLSLCMIVRNEARHLERCLSSVQGMISEILIADTGSEDESIEIARSFGARVISIPWENDFAKARNRILREASCSWILVLDADEAADHWNIEEINRLLATEETSGYFLPMIHYVDSSSEGGDYVTDAVYLGYPGSFHRPLHFTHPSLRICGQGASAQK
ncbi:glycosyltransferase family 2 protein [Paenibacillus sp. BR2-3]|uniref:glycosyltransferase family 2 protein n=1 Tax=Paenibacillus sp. BR2-3 TaxID=3048494 RepID=UPI003977972B